MMELALLYKWINFCIFIGLLFYFLREPLRDFLGDRRESLRKELDEVARERLKIERRFQEYRKKLAEADGEIEAFKKELRQEGEMEKASLIKKAQSFAKKIREDSQKVGEQELGRAKQALKKKVLLLAVDLARESVEKSIESKDQERLFELGIQNMEKSQGPA